MTTVDPDDDDDGFAAFYRGAKDGCLRAVLATTLDADHAEECTAEAFARALQRWDRVRRHPAPAAWVVRTAVNVHRDRHRRRRLLRRLLPVLAAPEAVEPVSPAVDPQVMAALRALPARQREVVALRVLVGLSGGETAEALGISAGSVGVHLSRGLAALRRHLAPPPGTTVPPATPTCLEVLP